MNNTDIVITFAGDFTPDEKISSYQSESFATVKEKLSKSDFNIINLESPITSNIDPINKTGMHFSASPDSLKTIKNMGFNAVCLANNHIYDHGDLGIRDTIKECQENGLSYVGAGINTTQAKEPLIVNIKDKTIAFINACENEFSIASENHGGANHFDIIDIHNDIKKVKKVADFIFVIVHGGLEYHSVPLPQFKKKCEFVIDSGADGVIGHHPHYLSGYTIYKEKPIFYSLGNFYSHSKKNDNKLYESYMVRFIIQKDAIIHSLIQINHDRSSQKVIANDLSSEMEKEINHINNVINDDNNLETYWAEYLKKEKKSRLNFIYSKSKNVYRLRKYLGINKKLSKHQLLGLLNIIRCESHHETLKMILEDEYKKWEK